MYKWCNFLTSLWCIYKLLLYNMLLVDLSALVIETDGVYLQTSVGLADSNDGSYR